MPNKAREMYMARGDGGTVSLERSQVSLATIDAAIGAASAYVKRWGLGDRTELSGVISMSDGISRTVIFDSSTSMGVVVTAREMFLVKQ